MSLPPDLAQIALQALPGDLDRARALAQTPGAVRVTRVSGGWAGWVGPGDAPHRARLLSDDAGVGIVACSCRVHGGWCVHAIAVAVAAPSAAPDPLAPCPTDPPDQLQAWRRQNTPTRHAEPVVAAALGAVGAARRAGPTLALLRALCVAERAVQRLRAADAWAADADRWRRGDADDAYAESLRAVLWPLRRRLAATLCPSVVAHSGRSRLKVAAGDAGDDSSGPTVALLPSHDGCASGGPTRLDLRALHRAPRCGCAVDVACTGRLRLVDVLLDELVGPAPSSVGARMRRYVPAPGWRGALDALDALLPRGGRAAAGALGWQLRLDADGPRVRAVLVGEDSDIAAISDASARSMAGGSDADLRALDAVSAGDVIAALDALAGHPRLFDGAGLPMLLAAGALGLRWDETPARGLRMRAAVDGYVLDDKTLERLLQGAESSGRALFRPPAGGALRLVRLTPDAVSLVGTLRARGMDFPAEAVPQLLSRQIEISAMVPVTLGPGLCGETLPPDLRPLLRLSNRPDGALLVQLRVRPLAGAPAFPPGHGPETLYAYTGGRRVVVHREIDREFAETRAAWRALDLGHSLASGACQLLIEDPDDALDFIGGLRDRAEDLQLEWESAGVRLLEPVQAAGLQLSTVPGRDWLGLDGFFELDGFSLALGAMLDAIRAGRRYVQVADATWARISEPLRAAAAGLAMAVDRGDGLVRLSPVATVALTPLQDAGARFEINPAECLDWDRINAARVAQPAIPDALQATLRPYQRAAFTWMARLAQWAPGACLADDMGLGKTVQALALLLHRAALGPALVVAPTSVGANWLSEAARFAPSLRTVEYRGARRAELLASLGPGVVLVTSYDLLTRDADALGEHPFSTVVFDEAHYLKNPIARRSRAAGSLQSDFTLALSGTPVENRPSELWSLFQRLVPGLLGPPEQFRVRFGNPINQRADPVALEGLRSLVRPFLLRRRKIDVAPELPPRTELTIRVELSAPERALYEAAKTSAVDQLRRTPEGDTWRFALLAALTRLRQLACHPRLFQPTSRTPSTKLAVALELISEIREAGHRALVFSQFTAHLALLREALDAADVPYGYLDGRTSTAARAQRVRAFQAGQGDLFLLSLKAGGVGLNLTGASYVVHLDPWWNPAAEDQATDRAHRIGQQLPVTVYRLVTADTIEDGMAALQGEKRRMVQSLLERSDRGRAPDVDELAALLGLA